MKKIFEPFSQQPEDACIFCQIARGEVPADIVFRDETTTAFWDANPAAPVHILLIPNKHIPSINDIEPDDEAILGHIFTAAAHVARTQGIAESGFRLVANTGPNAGQTVMHLHFHLIGGKHLGHHLKW